MRDIRHKNIRFLLYPISVLYGVVVWWRNKLYEWKIFRSKSFDIPVIVVGNITVGGTGKTPMVEYLIRLLQERYKVAVISRGYGRKSKGFVVYSSHTTAYELGDEPLQIARKFPKIRVAVDADRCRAIQQMKSMYPEIDLFLLDDAFQHRRLTPSFSILLMDFGRPVWRDRMLPLGDLRDLIGQLSRADRLVVTKCSLNCNRLLYSDQWRKIGIIEDKIGFSGLKYGSLLPLDGILNESLGGLELQNGDTISVLIVSGIAHNELFVEEVSKHFRVENVIAYADHHLFEAKDFEEIDRCYSLIANKIKCIVVTEKDAMRLREAQELSLYLRSQIYYLPIEMVFLDEKMRDEFNKTIIDHVEKNRGDGFIH